MAVQSGNLIWIDLEMTGLNPDYDHIIELAAIITDSELNIIAEGSAITIHQSNEILDNMDQWNTNHHTQSGLVDRARNSRIDEAKAQTIALEFIAQYVAPGTSPMCGNSICQDRRFLHRYMPNLEGYFHYRNLDVSSIKILAQRWAPDIAAGINKLSTHVALEDIRGSIAELRYYREHLFNL